MTRGKSLIRGSALRVLFQATQVVVSFLITPVIVNKLGNVEYGLWGLVGSFVLYFGLMDFGLSSATARFLSRALARQDPREEKEYVDTGIVVYCFLSVGVLLMGLALIALGPMIVKEIELLSLFRTLVAITAFNVAVYLPFRVFFGILKARLQYDVMSVVAIAVSVAKSVAIYVVLSLGFGVISLALISLVAMLLESYAIYVVAAKYQIFNFRKLKYKRTRMVELFSFSAYTFIASIAELLTTRIDSLLISIYLSVERITPYSLGYSLIRYANDFTISILGTLEPIFSQEDGRQDADSMRRILIITSKISAVICTLCFSIAAIYGYDFIVRWIGSEFVGLSDTILWLCVANFSTAVQRPAISLLYGISKHRFYAGLNVAEGVSKLLLSTFLIQRLNILGVAIGSAVPAFFLKVVVLPFYVCKAGNLPMRVLFNEFIFRGLFLCTLFNIGYYVVTWRYITPDYAIISSLVALQVSLYGVFVFFAVFSRTERTYLLQFFRIKSLLAFKVIK